MASSSRPSEDALAEALVRDSIAQRRLLAFRYEGRHRVVEPYVFGFSRGRKELLAYQVGGSATGGSVPDWYRFDLTAMSGVEIVEEPAEEMRDVPRGRLGEFDVVLASAVDRWL